MDPERPAAGRLRTGHVAITGASGKVGRALRARLADLPNDVRPLDRGDDARAAFRDAEAVVHLAGTLQPRRPNTYRAANLDTALSTVAALVGSSVRRVVFLSFVTARPGSPNPYLRLKAEAESALRASGTPAVILRCGHIYGPPADPGPTAASFLGHGGRVRLLGSGNQLLAPVFRGDVADVIVRAALDGDAPTGTFELVGPETFSAAELARRLNPDGVRVATIPGPVARLLPLVVGDLTRPLVDVMLADAVGSAGPAEPASRAFGVRLRTLGEVWRA